MKINTSDVIKNLEGKAMMNGEEELTVGKALANILLADNMAGKMKAYVLAQKLYSAKEAELDSADLSLIKSAVEKTTIYNNLVAGQLLVILDK